VRDVERLQRAVDVLVGRYRSLREENARLSGLLEEQADQLRELNQRRQDAQKRLDDLVARIDELDAHLEAAS
jgi:chromosome segregation ATPase